MKTLKDAKSRLPPGATLRVVVRASETSVTSPDNPTYETDSIRRFRNPHLEGEEWENHRHVSDKRNNGEPGS